jgi:hypothetical protein
VWTTQNALPENLRTTYGDVLRPELIALLRDNLLPLRGDVVANHALQAEQYKAICSTLSERYEGLSSGISALKDHIDNSNIMQLRIESSLRDRLPLLNLAATRPVPQQAPEGTRLTRKIRRDSQDPIQTVSSAHDGKGRMAKRAWIMYESLIAKCTVSVLHCLSTY